VKWGPRSLGIVGLGSACLFTIAAMMTRQQLPTVILLSLVYGAITFQLKIDASKELSTAQATP
jgi:hypothetical protein